MMLKRFGLLGFILVFTFAFDLAEGASRRRRGRKDPVGTTMESLETLKADEVTPVGTDGPRTGKVTSLTDELLKGKKRVSATGSAPIVHGNIQRARREALLDAYRLVVSTEVGVEIQALTTVKNCEDFTSLVVEKSRGYIRSYEILAEDIDKKTQTYKVVIEAEVVEGSMKENGDELALRTYLELANNPTLLILLSDKPTDGTPAPISEAIAPGAVELALAKLFHDLGYVVQTADDLAVGHLSEGALRDWLKQSDVERPRGKGKITEARLLQARRGYTAAAREVGLLAEADLVICGTIKVAGGPVFGDGPGRLSVTSYVKSVVCSTGQVLNITIKKVVNAKRQDLPQELAALVGNELAWEIPLTLAKSGKKLKIGVTNATIGNVAAIDRILNRRKDIESAVMNAWSREKGKRDRGSVVFTLRTSFLGPTAGRISNEIVENVNFAVQPVRIGKFQSELRVAD